MFTSSSLNCRISLWGLVGRHIAVPLGSINTEFCPIWKILINYSLSGGVQFVAESRILTKVGPFKGGANPLNSLPFTAYFPFSEWRKQLKRFYLPSAVRGRAVSPDKKIKLPGYEFWCFQPKGVPPWRQFSFRFMVIFRLPCHTCFPILMREREIYLDVRHFDG